MKLTSHCTQGAARVYILNNSNLAWNDCIVTTVFNDGFKENDTLSIMITPLEQLEIIENILQEIPEYCLKNVIDGYNYIRSALFSKNPKYLFTKVTRSKTNDPATLYTLFLPIGLHYPTPLQLWDEHLDDLLHITNVGDPHILRIDRHAPYEILTNAWNYLSRKHLYTDLVNTIYAPQGVDLHKEPGLLRTILSEYYTDLPLTQKELIAA